MFTIFRHIFSRSRGQILGWGIGLGLLGMYLVYFYNSMLAQREQWEMLLETIPPEMLAFFGGITDMLSAEGYLNAYFFSYMPVVLGIFAVLAGSGLLSADEENGTLDLVMAHPISRAAIFLGRLLAFMAVLFAILALTWLFFVVSLPFSDLAVTPGQLALPFLSLFALLLLFGCLALLLAMLLPSRSVAATTAGLVLVASYILDSLKNLDANLEPVAALTPLHYFQGAAAIDGLNWGWLAVLIGISAGLALLAWVLFERRDIRVGGEGGWRLWDKPART